MNDTKEVKIEAGIVVRHPNGRLGEIRPDGDAWFVSQDTITDQLFFTPTREGTLTILGTFDPATHGVHPLQLFANKSEVTYLGRTYEVSFGLWCPETTQWVYFLRGRHDDGIPESELEAIPPAPEPVQFVPFKTWVSIDQDRGIGLVVGHQAGGGLLTIVTRYPSGYAGSFHQGDLTPCAPPPGLEAK